MKKSHAFWAAFWHGLAAPAMAFSPSQIPTIESPTVGRSDRDAMRGDWERIGGDFRNVIAREEARHRAG